MENKTRAETCAKYNFSPQGIRKRTEYYKRNKGFISELKTAPCKDCSISYPACVMDFDHRDPTTKRGNIGRMWNWSRKLILEEISKCDLVCSNCHRLRTWRDSYGR